MKQHGSDAALGCEDFVYLFVYLNRCRRRHKQWFHFESWQPSVSTESSRDTTTEWTLVHGLLACQDDALAEISRD